MSNPLFTPNCIRTVSGRYVNLLDPDPETIDIEDIAYAQAHTPRFGGHLPAPYTVAEHSMEVARMVPTRQALLHDASEAYLCDLPSPLKAMVPDYRAIEERMMHAIARRFGFPWPASDALKAADHIALQEEWHQRMLCLPGTAMPDGHRIRRSGSPQGQQAAFLFMFSQLTVTA